MGWCVGQDAPAPPVPGAPPPPQGPPHVAKLDNAAVVHLWPKEAIGHRLCMREQRVVQRRVPGAQGGGTQDALDLRVWGGGGAGGGAWAQGAAPK